MRVKVFLISLCLLIDVGQKATVNQLNLPMQDKKIVMFRVLSLNSFLLRIDETDI